MAGIIERDGYLLHTSKALNNVDYYEATRYRQKQWVGLALVHVPAKDSRLRGIRPLVLLARRGTESQKHWAARAIGNLAHDPEHCVAIRAEAGIAALVSLLEDGTAMQKDQAAWALAVLSVRHDNKAAIFEARGIKPLVVFAMRGTRMQQEYASVALANLAFNNDEHRHAILQAQSQIDVASSAAAFMPRAAQPQGMQLPGRQSQTQAAADAITAGIAEQHSWATAARAHLGRTPPPRPCPEFERAFSIDNW